MKDQGLLHLEYLQSPHQVAYLNFRLSVLFICRLCMLVVPYILFFVGQVERSCLASGFHPLDKRLEAQISHHKQCIICCHFLAQVFGFYQEGTYSSMPGSILVIMLGNIGKVRFDNQGLARFICNTLTKANTF